MESEIREQLMGQDGYEDDLSLIEMGSLVLRHRKLILVPALVGIIAAFAYILLGSSTYTATASFSPHYGEQGGTAGLSGLAQQFGVSVPRSSDNANRSLEFYQDLIRSREILDGAIDSGVVVPSIDGMSTVDLTEYFGVRGNTLEERKARTREFLLEEILSASMSQLTGVISLSVRTEDPKLSAAIASRLLDLVSEFDLESRKLQASAERSFANARLTTLEAELVTAEDSLRAFLDENRQFANSPQLTFQFGRLERQVMMRQELVTSMAQAYEQARIDEVRNTPVITLIDQPDIPALPDPTKRISKILIGLVFGAMVGFVLAFVREMGEQAENKQSRTYNEFQKLLRDAKGNPFGFS